MRWNIIEKDIKILSLSREYKECKEDLAIEASHKCLYCCIHESRFGGIRNFHIEHYKPKSKFPELTNNYSNLFYSCSICNCFKGNDWPNEPNDFFDKPFYINPLLFNYDDYFVVEENTGLVHGKNKTAKYMIQRLYLNRPQLINERIFYFLMVKLEQKNISLELLNNKLSQISNEKKILLFDLLNQLTSTGREISDLQIKLHNISPYTIAQITK